MHFFLVSHSAISRSVVGDKRWFSILGISLDGYGSKLFSPKMNDWVIGMLPLPAFQSPPGLLHFRLVDPY